jgi:hypothetical protein
MTSFFILILKRVTESRFSHSEAGYGSLFSGHKRINSYFSGKSVSRKRYPEAAYSKIIRFSQEFSQQKENIYF